MVSANSQRRPGQPCSALSGGRDSHVSYSHRNWGPYVSGRRALGAARLTISADACACSAAFETVQMGVLQLVMRISLSNHAAGGLEQLFLRDGILFTAAICSSTTNCVVEPDTRH